MHGFDDGRGYQKAKMLDLRKFVTEIFYGLSWNHRIGSDLLAPVNIGTDSAVLSLLVRNN
jgi:hypothetical protein